MTAPVPELADGPLPADGELGLDGFVGAALALATPPLSGRGVRSDRCRPMPSAPLGGPSRERTRDGVPCT
jgi:hypothetical protein